VVRGLLDAHRLDREGHAAHRREDRVDRDHADRRGAAAGAGEVALAALDGQVDREAALAADGRDVQVLVEDLDVRGGDDVTGGDLGGARHVEAQGDRLVGGGGHHHVLEVQDDVGDVLGDPGDRVELVQGIVEADLGDGSTGD